MLGLFYEIDQSLDESNGTELQNFIYEAVR